MKKRFNFILLLSIIAAIFSGIVSTSAQNWEPTSGPYGGSLYCFAKKGSYLFTGTGVGVYAKGVFRSADNGATWTAVNNGLSSTSQGLEIEFLCTHGNYIIAATGAGIYRSSDNGANWTAATPYGALYVPLVLISNGTTLFAGGISGCFTSTDDGQTWTSLNANFPGFTDQNPPKIRSFVYCDIYLYAGTQGKGIFRSSDNGATWVAVNSGFGTGITLTRRTFVNMVSNGTDVWSGCGAGGFGAGVFHLVNNGTTWVNTGLSLNTQENQVLLIKDNVLYAKAGTGIWSSPVTGTTSWTLVNGTNQLNSGIRWLSVNGSEVFAGIGFAGFYRSNDNLMSWAGSNQGLAGFSTQSITKIQETLYATTYWGGQLYTSTNLGQTWVPGILTGATGGPWGNSTVLFCNVNGGDMYRSLDNGTTWQKTTSFFDLTWSGPTAMFVKGDTVYAGGGGPYGGATAGVFYSVDNGESWSQSTGIDIAPTLITANGNKLYASGSGMYVSEDNGQTWTSTASYPPEAVNSLIFTGGKIFAGSSSGVYLSTDNFATWNLVNNGLPINPAISALVTEGASLYASIASGVYYSGDNGDNWAPINQGFPTIPNANTLVVSGNYLFANFSYEGKPVYRLDLSGLHEAPLQPDAISGSATPCRGSSQTYSVPNVPGVTYSWQFPIGWIILGQISGFGIPQS